MTANLEGRIAKCVCGKTEPSAEYLAFFVFRGEGSRDADNMCGVCRYANVAHNRTDGQTQLRNITDHAFVAHGAFPFDSFYCGCRGWD